MQQNPSSNMLMFQAVLFWIVAYWLIEIAKGEPMSLATAAISASVAMGLAIGSVTRMVEKPSPFHSAAGQVLWALRPRKWLVAWALIVGLIVAFGRPMILNSYGGGQCQYIDWWFEPHVLPAHGDGPFQGCRFLAGG